MRVSVVATVLNEAGSLSCMLDGLAGQTRPPDEVVICDGGSTDGTLQLLEAERRVPLCVVRRPGANIAQGRNAAIEAATGEVIAVTDAGVRLSPHWLEKIVAPFEDAGTQAVAGFFLADPHHESEHAAFETAMGATVLPDLHEIRPAHFLPSSRSVAFRKHAWAAVGGYPEWIDYCEDLIFDLRLRSAMVKAGNARLQPGFVFAPEALVYFQPRSNLRAFFVQYYRYARGDGKADLWRKRHAIRYLAYLVTVPLIAAAGARANPWWWGLYLVAIPAMFRGGWRRLVRAWGGLSYAQRLQALLWVPIIRVTGDVAKMLGYPVGVWWRWRHRSRVPDWRVV